MQFIIRCIMCFPLLLACSTGCTTSKSPEEVARRFWDAVAEQDRDAAARYVTEAGRANIDFWGGHWRAIVVRFGERRIDGDDANIATHIDFPDGSAHAPVRLSTVLRREQERWRVDYQKTMRPLLAENAVSDVVEALKRFSQRFSGEVERGLSEVEKNIPEIERQFRALGDSVGETLKKTIPELQKGMESFLQSLRKALEDAGRDKRPQQPPERKAPDGATAI